MRTFIALNFSDSFKQKISFSKYKINGIKWVETQNIHLTLVFLGDIIKENNLEILKNSVSCVSRFKKFNITISHSGAFPDFERPRVLWLGIDKGENEILNIYSVLSNKLKENGFIFEARFSPHITIGRVKGKIDKKFIEEFKNYKIDNNLEEEILSVDIMQSLLTSSGPIYKNIYSEKLI